MQPKTKMKVRATKASARDNGKFTFSTSELHKATGYSKIYTTAYFGQKIILTVKGDTNRKYDVVLSPSRNGNTFYGDCPRGLKMPSVGRPVFYKVVSVVACQSEGNNNE